MKNKKILILIACLLVVGSIYFVLQANNNEEAVIDPYSLTETDIGTIARDWMENQSLTYRYDGYDLKKTELREIGPQVYEVFFTYNSTWAGHGDRSKEMTPRTVTPHQTIVTIDMGKVTSAVTDNIFSETENLYIAQ